MKDQKNMYPRKTRHEKSRRIIYEFSYKMGVLNEKRCKNNLKYINCISCSLPFKRLLNETWRTKCRDCYSTNRK